MLCVEGWDGENAVFDVSLNTVGGGNVLRVCEDHGDKFLGCEFLSIDGEAYSGTCFVVGWCDGVVAFC